MGRDAREHLRSQKSKRSNFDFFNAGQLKFISYVFEKNYSHDQKGFYEVFETEL